MIYKNKETKCFLQALGTILVVTITRVRAIRAITILESLFEAYTPLIDYRS